MEKNLPIKIILPRSEDRTPNTGGGTVKFFCDVTPELQENIVSQFNHIETFYNDVFNENELIPAVGKITVKTEAIAKSHKPSDLCRYCDIIGGEDLDEIYIKVTKKSIQQTVNLIKNIPSQKFAANLTSIESIMPVTPNEKISQSVFEVVEQNGFEDIKNKIKLKWFDFDNEFDNNQILQFIISKLNTLGFEGKYNLISYGNNIKYLKIKVSDYRDIVELSKINGVKSIDFFQEYSLPTSDLLNIQLSELLEYEHYESDVTIGIIDGGISPTNKYIAPYIIHSKCYVSEEYQNHNHATFIASTIQYGDKLNNLPIDSPIKFKFIDIIAVPNGDINAGPVDSINEEELMEIIEETMEEFSDTTKIWNLSLGIPNKICSGTMSDLGTFLDYIQDKYNVQFFISSGNIIEPSHLRDWPTTKDLGNDDRLISPAESVRAITIGSVALYDSATSMVKKDEPSPFSRRGPGANYIVKPEVVDYGGNISKSLSIVDLGMRGLDIDGNVVEGIGTSYSTPRVVQKFAAVYDEMVEKDILLAKTMIIHSARMNSRNLLDKNAENIKYYGFGMPSTNPNDILQCSNNEVTLVFKQKIIAGTHLEMFDFPFPKSLIKNGKCHGEIGMTLAYAPMLDSKYAGEYCRANIDVSFGMYHHDSQGKVIFKGCVPLESTWEDKYESARVENGFKWSPIKSYYRKISKQGIGAKEGWKIRVDMTPRHGSNIIAQDFVLIVTIKDPNGEDIYTDVINELREKGYLTANLETRQQLRQRN